MADQLALGSGGPLRQLRAEAGLTREELAEAASLGPRLVSDLERGINRTAGKDTAELLRAGVLPPLAAGVLAPGSEKKLSMIAFLRSSPNACPVGHLASRRPSEVSPRAV